MQMLDIFSPLQVLMGFDAPCLELSLNYILLFYNNGKESSFDAPYLELSLNNLYVYSIFTFYHCFDAPCLELSLNMQTNLS